MGALLVSLGLLAYIAAAVLFRGWVLSILWAWFAVPFGLPPLTIPWAIGISCIMGMFSGGAHSSKSEDDNGTKALLPFILALMALGIGWVAHVSM